MKFWTSVCSNLTFDVIPLVSWAWPFYVHFDFVPFYSFDSVNEPFEHRILSCDLLRF